MENSKGKISKALCLYIVCITLFTVFFYVPEISAEGKGEPKVLVIYTSKDGEIDEYQRSLDMLISHFTTDVTFISSNEVAKKDLEGVTHLFYYGQVFDSLPPTFLNLLDDYNGSIVAIGYNSEQLGDKFVFVHPLDETAINQLYLTGNKDKKLDLISQNIIKVQMTEGTEVLLEGTKEEETSSYPVMVKNQNNYYLALDNMSSQNSILFGEILHDVFQLNHNAAHPGYIRLEDVHPLVDPKPIRQIAKILKEKNIPYMIAVIPVYTDPETGKKHTFSDSPELLKILKEMQKDGGSIVLHGYTHQFRSSETGEGFEFWDVEHNTPIYGPADESFTIQKEQDFESKAEYESYINNLKNYETKYIETKLTNGIQELTKYGLYPLAFEAPHYTMSQNGYKVVSEYFSTYIGQIQLSDNNWKVMDSTTYITSPSFLNGMELLPETLGYVNPDDPQAIEEIMSTAEKVGLTQDGMFAAFYHPYLGVDGFKKLITEMERLPNISWIDLKQMDQWVKAENVAIHTENGEIKVDVNREKLSWSSLEVPLLYFKEFIDNIVLWGMAIVGGVGVLAFIIFTVHLKSRKNQIEG